MLSFKPFNIIEHNSHYSRIFSTDEYNWIKANAKSKAKNIANILGNEKSGLATVLEVGCGSGMVLNEIATLGIGSDLVGVDMEDPGLHSSQNRANNVRLQQYDGRTLPFENATFDFVYATHVLEHVPNEREFLAELRRVSKRLIYLEVPCELHMRSNQSAIQSTLNIGHINFYTPDSFLATIETSGLKVVRADIFDFSNEVYFMKSSSAAKAAISAILRKSLAAIDKRTAAKFFCFHCGALCKPS